MSALVVVGPAHAVTSPTGRAYEMVSPLDKNGDDVDSDGARGGVQAAPHGNSVVYSAGGSFSGSPSNPLVNHYLATRGPLSWSSLGISPAQGPAPFDSEVLMASEDLSRTVVRTNAVLAPGAVPDVDKLYRHDVVANTYELLTPAPLTPSPTTNGVFPADASNDLSSILFESDAQLTPESVGVSGRKLYLWANGALSLASILPGTPETPGPGSAGQGTGTNGSESSRNMLSDDGSVVFFSSPTNTVTGRLNRRAGGQTVFVNAEENSLATVAPGLAIFRGATPNGSRVIFSSAQQLVDADTNTAGDLYMYTHSADPTNDANLTLITPDTEPVDGSGAGILASNASGGVLGMSDDGRTVYFVATGQLLLGEDTTAPRKLYMWNATTGLRFIGGLPIDGSLTDHAGAPITLSRRALTPDGSMLLLSTAGQLTPDNNGGLRQVYLYDADADQTTCISCPSGGGPIGAADLRRGLVSAAPLDQPFPRRNLSLDGSRAFFESETALVPGDTNGRVDVYMWENGAPHLVSTGTSSDGSHFLDATPSGDDVFFSTRQRLVGWDTDDLRDLYVASVDGGLPEPQDPPAECVADECQGPQSGFPPAATPGSASLPGTGDVDAGPRASFSVLRLGAAGRRRLSRGRAAIVRVRVNRGGKVSLVARADIGRSTRIVARGSRRAVRAGVVRVPLRLRKFARRSIADGRTLRVAIRVRFAGSPELRRLTLTLTPANTR